MFDPSRFVTSDEMSEETREALERGLITPATIPFHAAWYAMGKEHICYAVPEVKSILVRNSDDDETGTLGIMYMVRQEVWPSPEAVPPEDHEALIVATMSFMRAMGMDVYREEGTDILHARVSGRDLTVNANPFSSEVEDFVSDMEKALGPSAVKDDPDDPMARWYR